MPSLRAPRAAKAPPAARDDARQDLDLFFEVALEFLCTASFDGYFKRLNPRWSQVLGWTDAELKSKPFLEFVHPDDRDATLQAAGALSRGTDVVNFVNRYACKDGTWRWLSWNSFGAVDRGLIIAAARDVTEQKQMEMELGQHREHLERLVEDRTAELRRTQELVTRQAREILDLSTPVLQIREGVVAAPLIGSLDSLRAEQFTERLLQVIVDTRSTVAIVDITGVPAIDTQCARYLLEATAAVRLLGAQVVMTGIRPAIAQTLVHLGVDLSTIVTRSSLLAGLQVAEEMRRKEGERTTAR